jgi:2'-5' RNA ligase
MPPNGGSSNSGSTTSLRCVHSWLTCDDRVVARLFFAVWPPEAVVQLLRAMPRADAPGVRWVPEANWHVTLRFLGEADPSTVCAALDGTRLPAATAALGPAIRRLGRNMVVVPVGGLDALAAAVTAPTARVGERPEPRPFTGHITIARLRRGGRTAIEGTAVEGGFTVDEVLLVRSDLSPRGATYEPIASWPTSTIPGR